MSKKELKPYRDFIDSERVFHVNFQLIVNELLEKLQQKENIIKEVREYIGSKEHYEDDFDIEIEKVYKILDKEVN